MTLRILVALCVLSALSCTGPSSENATKEPPPAANDSTPSIGQKTDATMSGEVASSTTSDAGAAPAVVDAGPSARAVAPGAYGAVPTARGDRADGSACTRGDECASGTCEGEGCGVDEGRCVAPGRLCTKDLKAFCGCDGQTFRSSGTCPNRTFSAKGMCKPPR